MTTPISKKTFEKENVDGKLNILFDLVCDLYRTHKFTKSLTFLGAAAGGGLALMALRIFG